MREELPEYISSGEAHIGISERIDTILNFLELKSTMCVCVRVCTCVCVRARARARVCVCVCVCVVVVAAAVVGGAAAAVISPVDSGSMYL